MSDVVAPEEEAAVEPAPVVVDQPGDLKPAFAQTAIDPFELQSIKDQCFEVIELMEGTYGPEDVHTRAMRHTFDVIVEDDLPLSWRTAKAFLVWAKRHPDLLTTEALKDCPKCENGWQLVKDQPNTHRPCSRCNTERYNKFILGKGEEIEGEPAAPPPPKESWDSYGAGF